MKLGDTAKINAPNRQLTNLQQKLRDRDGKITFVGERMVIVKIFDDKDVPHSVRIQSHLIEVQS